MDTVAIARLKAHLSAELKRVRAGETLTVLDHRTPVARIVPLEGGITLSRPARRAPKWQDYVPLVKEAALKALDEERGDSW